MNARIHTHSTLGFCTSAKVKRGTQTIYETRAYPFGFDSQAYQDAYDWAKKNGVKLVKSQAEVAS